MYNEEWPSGTSTESPRPGTSLGQVPESTSPKSKLGIHTSPNEKETLRHSRKTTYLAEVPSCSPPSRPGLPIPTVSKIPIPKTLGTACDTELSSGTSWSIWAWPIFASLDDQWILLTPSLRCGFCQKINREQSSQTYVDPGGSSSPVDPGCRQHSSRRP